MQRIIEAFHQDDHGDWVAELSCGHGQHVRHKPPFEQRPWVVTEDGRAGRIGTELPCVLCDRLELPGSFEPYKRTREFDEASIPAGLLAHHTTARGVWGVIHVISGQLRYIIEPPLAGVHELDPERHGVVPPEVRHRVEPRGPVRFFVEFHRRPAA